MTTIILLCAAGIAYCVAYLVYCIKCARLPDAIGRQEKAKLKALFSSL